MPELEFKAHGAITLKELRKVSNQQMVYRSAHVGNIGLYNLAGAASASHRRKRGKATGITLLLYDRNLVGVDKNYSPGAVIFGNNSTHFVNSGGKTLAGTQAPDRLSAFTELSPDAKRQISEKLGLSVEEIPDTLAGLHYKTAKKAYAQGSGGVMTQSEYFVKHEVLLKRILTAWVKAGKLEVFNRVLLGDGTVLPLKSTPIRQDRLFSDRVSVPVEELVQEVINANRVLAKSVVEGKVPELKKGEGHFGVLLEAKALYALHSLLDAYKGHPHGTKFNTERMQVFHLSGPDAIKYSSKPEFVKGVQELVRLAQPQAAFPKVIEFHLLPQTHLNFASDSKTVEKLETAVDLWKKLNALAKENAVKIKAATNEDRTRVIAECSAKINPEREKLRVLSRALGDYLGVHSQVTGFQRTTMYDVVHGKYGKLRLPHNIGDLTLDELGKLRQFMEQGASAPEKGSK